jgi:hypothetical protein
MKSNTALLFAGFIVILMIFFAIKLSGSNEQANLLPKDQPRQTISKNLFSGEYFFFRLKPGTKEFLSSLAESGEKVSFTEKGEQFTIEVNKLLPGDTTETIFPQGLKNLQQEKIANKKGFFFQTAKGGEFLFVRSGALYTVSFTGKNKDTFSDVVLRIKSK